MFSVSVPSRTFRPVGLALVLGVASLSAACNDTSDAGPVALVVEASDWNGWDEDHRSSVQEHALEGGIGESLHVDHLGGIDIEIVEIRDDEVVVQTSQEMAPVSADGGLSLLDLEDEFAVPRDGEVEFATATTDAGWTYTVSWPEGS